MSVARTILKSTAYQMLGKLMTIALSIVTIKLITSYLGGVEGYGEYTTIYEFLAFFAVGADMGIYTIAIREISCQRQNAAKILGNLVGLRMLLITVMMGLAVLIAFSIPQYTTSRIALGVCIAVFSTFFTMLHGSICSLLQVYYRMGFATFSSVCSKCISLLYILFIVYYATPRGLSAEMGFYHLLLAGVLGNAVMFTMVRFYSQKIVSWKVEFDWSFWKTVIRETFPYGLAVILSTVYFRIDTILLSVMRPDYLMQVGIYGVAVRILEALNIIPIYFMNSVLPVLSEHVKKGSARVGELISYACLFLALMGFPLVLGGLIFSREIVAFVSTDSYLSNPLLGFYGSDLALSILLFALLIAFFNTMLGYSLVALGRQSKLLWINGAGALLNVVLNLALIPSYGFVAAALTSIASELTVLACLWYTVRRSVRPDFQIVSLLKILFAALLMAVIIYLLKNSVQIYWLAFVPLAVLIYGIFIRLMGVITGEMQVAVFGKRKM